MEVLTPPNVNDAYTAPPGLLERKRPGDARQTSRLSDGKIGGFGGFSAHEDIISRVFSKSTPMDKFRLPIYNQWWWIWDPRRSTLTLTRGENAMTKIEGHTKGDMVVIYQRPLAQEKPEAFAVLVNCLREPNEFDYPGLVVSEWEVRFADDPDNLYRRVVTTFTE